MFRSIASIADDFGEDLTDPAIRLECQTAFSHGGPGPDDDAMESTYLTARLAMASLVVNAARFLARETAEGITEAIARGTAPVLVNFLGQIAGSFNIVVSQKFVAQSMPVIGAETGAVINAAFSDHFNTVAWFHFGIRKLERQHGQELVQEAYKAELQALKRLADAPKTSVVGDPQ
jgi:hypothetical protein